MFLVSITDGDKETDPEVSFDNLSFSINQQDELLLPVSLKQKQILYCDGKTVELYDKQWHLMKTLETGKSLP